MSLNLSAQAKLALFYFLEPLYVSSVAMPSLFCCNVFLNCIVMCRPRLVMLPRPGRRNELLLRSLVFASVRTMFLHQPPSHSPFSFVSLNINFFGYFNFYVWVEANFLIFVAFYFWIFLSPLYRLRFLTLRGERSLHRISDRICQNASIVVFICRIGCKRIHLVT